MINNEKQPFIEKILDYVLIFWCIVTIVFYVIFLLNIKYNKYQNEDLSTTSAIAYSLNEVTPYDTITDLTGTSWEFNDSGITPVQQGVTRYYGISFTSNNTDYISITIGRWDSGDERIIDYDDTNVYIDWSLAPIRYWQNTAYKTITITGGSDATNSNLITWLQANATQIQTGYSSTINLTNCTCNKSSETGLSGSYTATITANTGYVLTSVNSSLGTVTYSNNNKVAIVSISDVNDDFTISASASLIYHTISYNLGNVVVTSNKPMQIDEVSTISITFQPYFNYILPLYINVEGVSSYEWNHESGVLSLTNAYDDVVISINADYKSGDYTFVDLIDSVTLVPVNTFFNLFDFELFGVNLYHLLLSVLILFIIIKILLKIFR